jgi:hypothetical protein
MTGKYPDKNRNIANPYLAGLTTNKRPAIFLITAILSLFLSLLYIPVAYAAPNGQFTSTILVDFGTRYTGTTSPAESIFFVNEQESSVTIRDISTSGDTFDFNVDTSGCAGKTLNPGEYCEMSATFTPTNADLRSAMLLIDYGAGTHEVELVGFGLGVPPLQLVYNPGSLAFGNVPVGSSSAAQTVTVQNQSTFVTYFLSPTVTGPFSVSGCASIAPGASCNISVTFNPTALGPASGTASYDITDAFGTNYGTGIVVDLSGTGIAAIQVQQGRIFGKVTLNGTPVQPGLVKVNLNGGQPQNTDASGNYGYNNLVKGSYTVSLDYDKTKYKPDNAGDSRTVSVDLGQQVSVNFNLVSITTTTGATTTSPVPTTTTTVPVTVVTTTAPVTTTTGGPVNFQCNIPGPTPGVVELFICKLAQQPGQGGSNLYTLQFKLNNGLSNPINVQNSVEINLEQNVRVDSAQADAGNTRTENNGRRVVWSGYNVPAGRSATLNLTLEAPPASAGTVSNLLSQDALATVLDAVTGSRYEGRAGAFSSASGLSRTALQPQASVPSRVPSAGNGIFDGDQSWSWLALSLGLLVLGIGAIWAANSFRRSRYRK